MQYSLLAYIIITLSILCKKVRKHTLTHKNCMNLKNRKSLTLEVDALTVLMTISFLPFCRGQQDNTKLAS